MKRPLAISLMPNFEADDYKLAFKLLFKRKTRVIGNAQNILKDWFRDYFRIKDVYLFNSGRSALYILLKSYGIRTGDEVIIQGFTCIAVAEPVIWLGAKPVFAEIDDSLNLDPLLLERFITGKTKAIIVQHTFGVPAKIDLIKIIAQKHKLILLEDCAHAIGAEYKGLKLGNFGDASIFSFGRDKVVSSVFGGAAILNKKNPEIIKMMERETALIPEMSSGWVLKQLLYPLYFIVILPLYDLLIGKIILHLLVKFRFITRPVEKIEYSRGKPSFFPGKFPDALALLALNQLRKLDEFNQKRIKNAVYYFNNLGQFSFIRLPPRISGSIYLRFNIRLKDKIKLFRFFKSEHIILGNWYSNVIDPEGIDFKNVNYQRGRLKNAEKIALESLNLPTYPLLSKKDLDVIITTFKNYENQRN